MAVQTRPPRTRASGGRTLMLLGVLLALLAGIIVIYVVSQATSSANTQVTVVVAKKSLQSGLILSADTSDTTHILISDAFTTKQVSADFAPQNALPYTSDEDLKVKLNNQVIVGSFYDGDILRQNDPRLVAFGTGASGSLNLVNPSQLKPGDVIAQFDLKGSGKVAAVPGDYVDILVTECNVPGSKTPNGCESQTTLQNLYVYTVRDNTIYVVVSHQDALTLQYLQQSATDIRLVVRKPGDGTPTTTDPVDGGYVVSHFKF